MNFDALLKAMVLAIMFLAALAGGGAVMYFMINYAFIYMGFYGPFCVFALFFFVLLTFGFYHDIKTKK